MTVISARRTGALLLRQYYLIRGSVARLVPLFIWVTIDMVLWGFITKYLNTISGAGIDFVPRLLGAVLHADNLPRLRLGGETFKPCSLATDLNGAGRLREGFASAIHSPHSHL